MRIANLIITSVATPLWLLAAVVGGYIALFSPMLFDAPGSERITQLWIAFLAMLSFPVVALIAVVASWGFFAVRFHRTSLALLALPIVPWVIVVICFATIPGFMT